MTPKEQLNQFLHDHPEMIDKVTEIATRLLKEQNEEMGKNNLQAVRELRGISLEELSEMSGIPRETLKQIENGEIIILNTRLIAKLAEALDAKPSEIFTA